MKMRIMKKIKTNLIITLIFSVLINTVAIAQSTVSRTAYFMDNAPHKHILNPALRPNKGYISMPILGSFDLDIRTNLGMKTFLYPGINSGDPLRTFMHPTIGTEEFMNKLRNNNFIELNNRISLISFGFYAGDMFWNFDVASRIHADVNIPKDLFLFMKEGLPYNRDYTYSMDNIGANAHMMAEVALGTSINITDDIRVGAKAKLLLGGARAFVGMDRMQIHITPNNPDEKIRLESKGGADFYVKGMELLPGDDGYGIEDMNLSGPGIAGFGVGADLGAIWQTPIEFLRVSMGVTDLGFLNWGKKSHVSAKAEGAASYNGIAEFIGQEDPDSIPLMNQLMKMTQLNTLPNQTGKFQGLSPIITIGAEAGLPDYEYKYTLGLLVSNRVSAEHWVTEISAIANIKPIHHVNFSTNFTILNTVKGAMPSLGAALALDFYAGNIFLACDFFPLKYSPQFIPLNPVNTHIQFGLTWSIGQKHDNSLQAKSYDFFKKKE